MLTKVTNNALCNNKRAFSGFEKVKTGFEKNGNNEISRCYKYTAPQNFNESIKKPKEKKLKYCITVDWLSITVSGQFLKLSADRQPENIIKSYYNSNIFLERTNKDKRDFGGYRYMYNVYWHGELVGTIITSPHKGNILDSSYSVFKLSNHVLYRSDWTSIYKEFIEAFRLKFHHVTKLDIAIDGSGFVNQYDEMKVKGYKRVGRYKASVIEDNEYNIEGFSIHGVQGKTSQKYIRVYDKTKELKKSGKKYIKEYWKKNSLEAFQNGQVERFELALRAEAVKEIGDFDIMSLTNPAYLASIVQLQVKKMYEFYDPEENKNISRCEKIQAIDFEYFEAIQIKKLKRVQIPSPTKSAKLAISFLMKEAYAKEDNRAKELFEQNQVIATRIAYDYGQDAWFSKMLEKWKEDFIYLEAIKDTRRLVRRERDRLYSLNTQIF